MTEYHKIHSLFKRTTDGKAIIWGEYSLPEFEYLEASTWVFTEKVDGMNIRLTWDGERVDVLGKTDRAQVPAPLLRWLSDYGFTDPRRWAKLPAGTVLYGEGYGPGIQSGGIYGIQQRFILFDVMVGGLWLRRPDVHDVARDLGFDVVPVVCEGTLVNLVERVELGTMSMLGNCRAEGLVARPSVELLDRRGRRIITKLKARDFNSPSGKAPSSGYNDTEGDQ